MPPAVPCVGVTVCSCGAGAGLVAGVCVAAGRAQAATSTSALLRAAIRRKNEAAVTVGEW